MKLAIVRKKDAIVGDHRGNQGPSPAGGDVAYAPTSSYSLPNAIFCVFDKERRSNSLASSAVQWRLGDC